MKTRILITTIITVLVVAAGCAFAQMGGGNMGPGGGSMGGSNMPGPGPNPGPAPGPKPGAGYGYGYGMGGMGGMISTMRGNTLTSGYLDTLTPITTEQEARAAIQGFINLANSSLKISALWEYETVYKAELSDTNDAMAFDLVADKFTGAVSPEMGMSMMLNASYGKSLYKTSSFGKKLVLTPQQATTIAQQFVAKNALGYTLESPDIYPGYYKFHTKVGTEFGMDIMVNGYNGGIWMDTFLGLPLNQY
jgi:hypothetical protein